MVRVYADGAPVYAPSLEGYELLDLKATPSVEKAGTAEFTLPPDHPAYNSFIEYKTVIEIFRGDKKLFRGRVLYPADDMYRCRTITCEGERCFFRDSLLRPYLYQDSPANIFKDLVTQHNAQVDAFKRFRIGEITVTDDNEYVRLENGSAESVASALDKLVARCGGYIIFTDAEDGVRVINWYAELGRYSAQVIEFGENMLDYSSTGANTNLATAVLPYGAKNETSGLRTTIETVNGGLDYIQDDEAVARHGFILQPVTWDDVTKPGNLLTKARQYLDVNKNIVTSLVLTAIDLSVLKEGIDSFDVGDWVHVYSAPHGVNDYFQMRERAYDLLNPANDRAVFGKDLITLTNQTAALEDEVVLKAVELSTKIGLNKYNELDNLVKANSTAIDQTAEKIESKANQSDFDELGEMVRQNSTAIEQNAERIALKLNVTDPATGVDTENGIVLDETGVHIEGGVIEMNTTDDEEYVHITSEGVSASSMTAPNVMPRYDGPQTIYVAPEATDELIEAGNYVRSLQDALDRVNGRYVPYNVTVQMQAGMTAYEEISLKGAYFAAGFAILGFSNGHAKIVGRLDVRHCVGYIKVQYVDVNAGSGQNGMLFMGNGIFAHVLNCVITGMGVTGNDGSRCIGIKDGTKGLISGCELYDSEYAVVAGTLAQVQMTDNKGNCRYGVDAALAYVSGTAPCDESEFKWTYWNAGELRNAVTVVDRGNPPTAEAVPIITVYELNSSGSYAISGGWGKFDDTDIRQGYTTGTKGIISCMWFKDMAGLKSWEILQAKLRLTRMSGYGRSSAVNVSLVALKSGVNEAPILSTSYGTIGSFEAGQTTTVTIPVTAIEALANGTIKGLALFTGETEVYKDRNYSKNYARFAGGTSGTDTTKPEITVIYR